jgi:hypothetical protein
MGMDKMILDDAPWMEEEADNSAVAHCPYCGEPNELALDPVGGQEQGYGEAQSYVEDCQVCCQPWTVQVQWYDGEAHVQLFTEDGEAY